MSVHVLRPRVPRASASPDLNPENPNGLPSLVLKLLLHVLDEQRKLHAHLGDAAFGSMVDDADALARKIILRNTPAKADAIASGTKWLTECIEAACADDLSVDWNA